jgi:hypothetical protein
MSRTFAVSLVVVPLVFVSAAAPARNPISTERAAIRQVIFDYLAAKAAVKSPRISAIRISTRIPPAPPRPTVRYYSKFARIDLSDPSGGPSYAIAGYFVTGTLSGWRVLDLGSVEVGCSLPASIFRGDKRAVLRDLRMTCPR